MPAEVEMGTTVARHLSRNHIQVAFCPENFLVRNLGFPLAGVIKATVLV